MAHHMVAEGLVPDRVLCSTAVRTRQTWAGMRSILGRPPVEIRPDLYEATAADLLAIIRTVDHAVGRLLVLGHNPGLQRLGLTLAGTDPARHRQRLRDAFPTAALAVLDFDGDRWADMEPGTGRLVRLVRPKDLPDARARRL
jgi:phosphohistidine phosphatase